MTPPLAPAARIVHDPSDQRRYIGRAREATDDLVAFSKIAGQEQAKALLARRLRGLSRRLLLSPYYREVMRSLHLGPGDLRSLDDLRCLLSLDRNILSERFADLPGLAPDDPESSTCVVVKSSGTTGQPAPVLKDGYDCLHMWAVLRFFLAHLGRHTPPRPRVALLCSLPSGLEYEADLPILDDGHLARISVARPDPAERLARLDPHIVFSDPEGLHWLAAERPAIDPVLVLTSAQHFSPYERTALSRAFPCPVVNYYATTETGPIAWECLRRLGDFHVLSPDVWVESMDGDLLVTRLRQSILPLLRYRTGDRGEVSWTACRCGLEGFTISGFTGRCACLFETPAGATIDAWRLAWIWKHTPLREVKLTQRTAHSFDLRISGALRDEEAAALVKRLRGALAALGWDAARLRLHVVRAMAEGRAKTTAFATALHVGRE